MTIDSFFGVCSLKGLSFYSQRKDGLTTSRPWHNPGFLGVISKCSGLKTEWREKDLVPENF